MNSGPRKEPSATSNALSVVHTTTSLTRELTDMMQISAAGAAASVLLMIFETIEGIEANKLECERLAYRCYNLLSGIRTQMEGRWDTAPPSLIQNLRRFEKTLCSIHAFMKEEVNSKWHSRLLRKRTIERDLVDFTTQLDDATRSFEVCRSHRGLLSLQEMGLRYLQMSTLISIHHTLGDRVGSQHTDKSENTLPSYSDEREEDVIMDSPVSLKDHPVCAIPSPAKQASLDSQKTSTSRSSFEIINGTLDSSLRLDHKEPLSDSKPPDVRTADERHLPNWVVVHQPEEQSVARPANSSHTMLPDVPRFHQSQIKIIGRSNIKEGWWAGCVKADLGTKTVHMKDYEGDELSQERDAKILGQLRYKCLPKLAGLSCDGTPPFILIEDEATLTLQGAVRGSIKDDGIAGCTRFSLQLYIDLIELANYLQVQLQFSTTQVQDYLESASFRATKTGKVYVSPPSTNLDQMISVRDWQIVDTVVKIIQQTITKASSTKDATLRDGLAEVSTSIHKHLSKVTVDEPCPEWLRLLAQQSHPESHPIQGEL